MRQNSSRIYFAVEELHCVYSVYLKCERKMLSLTLIVSEEGDRS